MNVRRAGLLLALLFGLLILRSAVLVHMRLFGAVPELLVLAVVAVSLRDGPEAGAIAGFWAGILQDLATTYTPLGLSSLAFVLVGFAVGSAHSYVIRPGRVLPVALAAAATFSAVVLQILAGAVIGREYLVSTYQFRVALVAAGYSAALFPGVQLLVKRALKLVELDRAPAI